MTYLVKKEKTASTLKGGRMLVPTRSWMLLLEDAEVKDRKNQDLLLYGVWWVPWGIRPRGQQRTTDKY